MSREVRLARKMVLEYILLGVAISRDGDAALVQDQMTPDEMTSEVGRQLLDSIKTGQKGRFAKIMRRRYGVTIKEDERAIDGILRSVKLKTASETARAMSHALAVSIRDSDDLRDVVEVWEEGLSVLRKVAELKGEDDGVQKTS